MGQGRARHPIWVLRAEPCSLLSRGREGCLPAVDRLPFFNPFKYLPNCYMPDADLALWMQQ